MVRFVRCLVFPTGKFGEPARRYLMFRLEHFSLPNWAERVGCVYLVCQCETIPLCTSGVL